MKIWKGFILSLTQLTFNSSYFFLGLKVSLITSSGIILNVYNLSSFNSYISYNLASKMKLHLNSQKTDI